MSNKLRQRHNNKKKQNEKPARAARSNKVKKDTASASTSSSLRILLRYLVGAIVLFALRRLVHYVTLRRPDLVNELLGKEVLRPSVKFGDERQVLIVGTMSSGTTQVAADLTEKLGLEVGHELTDALDYPVRDGSSSWFHGIRFFEKSLQTNDIFQSLCLNFTEQMGFHPRQYHAVENCSEKKPWFPLSECWRKDCIDILQKEWGCAASGCNDTQPFRTTLLQVRDPRSTVESLVAKFCKDSRGHDGFSFEGTMDADWIKFHSTLFGHDFGTYNCIEAASYYVMEYNSIMMQAIQDGYIADMYKVESTSPCQVAKMAGFFTSSNVVYQPNVPKVQRKCGGYYYGSSTSSLVGTKPMTSTTNKINKGRLRFTWSDYEGGTHGSLRATGDETLVQDMKKLMISMGYNPESPRRTS